MLLRDQPCGTAARLLQHVIAWGNGRNIVCAFLLGDNETLIEEEFDPFHLQWHDWSEAFQRWRVVPEFERFDETGHWIREPPPFETGHVDWDAGQAAVQANGRPAPRGLKGAQEPLPISIADQFPDHTTLPRCSLRCEPDDPYCGAGSNIQYIRSRWIQETKELSIY
ncbi:hypothetical protein C7401_12445 [Paraburkholderia unamae]|uniref:hypothetical protein n=1 Tax=Paraburkholderia unamae TaxID=219649 RepID=UPI000DC5AA4A|nr:hypothetical protein [Paraburkholderia unamae]RAR54549.1 hypothetical protein C7401_12445 [Paraburkholderia unamae]